MLSGLDILIITSVKGAITYITSVEGFLMFAIVVGIGTKMITPIKNIINGNYNGDTNVQKRKR